MNKASFILVPSYSDSDWLNDKMMQITEAFIGILNIEKFPVYTVDSYNDINHFLDDAEYLIVATAGTVIIERDHLWKKINSIDPTVGLMGNLLQFGVETPWMHEQFFIIKTAAFKELDFTTGRRKSKGLIRSVEDMHDNHAPLYLTLGETDVDRVDKFGTRLIEHCLENGYKVRNWDMDWRYPSHFNDYILDVRLPTRGYCYPKLNTKTFEYALKNLELVDGLDEAQSMLIDAVIKSQRYNVVNAWQYEEALLNANVDTVIAPATGFLAETLAFKGNANKIIFYDKNPNNIEFKKRLYTEWDGKNYQDFVNQFAEENNLSIEPTLGIDVDEANRVSVIAKEEILSDWARWKQSKELEFEVCDCVLETDKLLSFVDKKAVLHTSTILTIYPFSAIMYSRDEIASAKRKLAESKVLWLQAN